MKKPLIIQTLSVSTSHVDRNTAELLDLLDEIRDMPSKMEYTYDDQVRDLVRVESWNRGYEGILGELVYCSRPTHHTNYGWLFEIPSRKKIEYLANLVSKCSTSPLHPEFPVNLGDVIAMLKTAESLKVDYLQYDPDSPTLEGATTYDW